MDQGGRTDSAVISTPFKDFPPSISSIMILLDSRVSPHAGTLGCQKTSRDAGCKMIDVYPTIYCLAGMPEPNRMSIGNLRARVRVCILYCQASIRNCLVQDSSDKSKYLVGCQVKFGYIVQDTMPFVVPYKTPQSIINNGSNLWLKYNTGKIGMTYEEVDSIRYSCQAGCHQRRLTRD